MVLKHSLTLLSVIITLNLTAQTELIVPIQPDFYENMEATNFIFSKPTTIWSHYIDVELDDLNTTDVFNLRFHNEDYNVSFDRKEIRSANNYSWFGTNTDGDGSIIITVLNGDEQAILTKGSEIYRILTTAKGYQAIVHIDQSQYPPEACFTDGHLIPGVQKNTPNQGHQKQTNHIQQALASGCTINGLVLYTPAAEAAMKGTGDPMLTDVKNAIQLAVDRTNLAFRLSEITNYNPIELVMISQLNFIEGGSAGVDIVRFKDSTFVQNLRNQYNADFCILITDDVYGNCGIAYVGASNNFAYGMVPYDCMIENLSFAHEFGHLFGADHDVDSSPLTTAGYAHGYIDTVGRWRTILGYPTPCTLNGFNCTRFAYYSNPDVNYIDGRPMGTAARENNARECRENYDNLAQFQQPVNTFLLTNTTYNNNNLYTTILAKQSITSSGSVIVQDSSTLILKAGQRIRLNNGFSTKSKANGHYGIETIEDCP